MASPSGLGVEGTDTVLQQLPRNQAVHPLQEQFPAGLAFLTLVFQVGKGGLVHTISSPVSVRLFSNTMLHRQGLVQRIPSITTTVLKKGTLSTSLWRSAHALGSFVVLPSAKRFPAKTDQIEEASL